MNKKEILTEKDLKLSSENATAFSAAATSDDSWYVDMPFKQWVRGTFDNTVKAFRFIANAPGAHINGAPAEYTISFNGELVSVLILQEFLSSKIIQMGGGTKFSISANLDYNKKYVFLVAVESHSTDQFEVRIDYSSYSTSGSDNCDVGGVLTPHGNYRAFSCEQAAVCNDGIGNGYGDDFHQGQTSYMNGILNADIHRYIVVPTNTSGYASLLGCVGVAIRDNGRYVFGVVGEGGPERNPGELDEFSVKMIKDLGFNTDCKNSVEPEEPVTTYIFPDTKRSSWTSDTLNADVESVGRQYFY